jgi:hypothetical protein
MDYSHETMGCAPRMAIDDATRSLTGRTVISESRADGATGGRVLSVARRGAARLTNSCFHLFIIMCAYAGAAAAASLFVCAAVPRPLLVINLVFSLPAQPRGNSFSFPKVLSINRCARSGYGVSAEKLHASMNV